MNQWGSEVVDESKTNAERASVKWISTQTLESQFSGIPRALLNTSQSLVPIYYFSAFLCHSPSPSPQFSWSLSRCYSPTSTTFSRHSRVILTPSSITTFGTARLCPFCPLPSVPFVAAAFELDALPFICVCVCVCAELRSAAVSFLISSMTFSISSVKLWKFSERRSERAWSCIKVGQFVDEE
jgi:hypothetical protein